MNDCKCTCRIKNIIEYAYLEEKDCNDLEISVGNFIEEGWELWGNPWCRTSIDFNGKCFYTVCQAMVKYDD